MHIWPHPTIEHWRTGLNLLVGQRKFCPTETDNAGLLRQAFHPPPTHEHTPLGCHIRHV